MDDQRNIEAFVKKVTEVSEEKMPKFDSHINIALVGKVGTGKSSLLNAIFCCDRDKPLAPVGAKSGVTTKITPYRLDDNVLIIDCPGLDDVRKENSAVTENFLRSIDIGILVVTDSVDSSQKAIYDDLKRSAKETIVVLNKIDRWDDLEESALKEVVEQWKSELGIKVLFPACTKGYDPKMRKNKSLDLRGVDSIIPAYTKDYNPKTQKDKPMALRGDKPMTLHGVNSIRDELRLQAKEKAILLAPHLENKREKAHWIIHSYAAAAAATSGALGSVPVVGVITGDSAALILITAKMCQSLCRDVFNQNRENIDWGAWLLGVMQFPLGVLGIKALASLIPLFGPTVNAGVSLATVEAIGWAAYHLLDDGKELDKVSKEEFKKAIDWAKKSSPGKAR